MGKKLVDQLLPALPKMRWPQAPNFTPLGHTTYEIAIQQADDFEGDPKDLANALKTLQTCDSKPYAFGGIAYVLLKASKEDDGTYYKEGLEAALEWLEKVHEMTTDLVNVNVIEALAYIYLDQLDDARLVLDFLTEQDSHNYFIALAEIEYWKKLKEWEQVEQWYERADQIAPRGPIKLYIQIELADFLAESQQWDRALEAYRKVIHFYQEDPRAWHKMAAIYFRQEDYKQAEHYNNRSLSLERTPAAEKLAEMIQEKAQEKASGLRGLFSG